MKWQRLLFGYICCLQCTAEPAGCCRDPDYELECLPSSVDSIVRMCSRPQSSEELAKQQLDRLQYGDSKGMMNSHAWADSWEFQSRSEMKREEDQAAEDLLWKKQHKISDTTDDLWKKIYKKVESGGKQFWLKLKKLKKLREVKTRLVDKYVKFDKSRELPESAKSSAKSEEHLLSITTPQVQEKERDLKSDNSWFYPSATSGPSVEESMSDESVIRFSEEIPKKERKIDFKIDNIINDATRLLNKKLKEKAAVRKKYSRPITEQEPLNLNDIINSEEKLRKEINELKSLKENNNNGYEFKTDGHSPEELIRKHVAAILEEERKLDKLKKLKELAKLEERQL